VGVRSAEVRVVLRSAEAAQPPGWEGQLLAVVLAVRPRVQLAVPHWAEAPVPAVAWQV